MQARFSDQQYGETRIASTAGRARDILRDDIRWLENRIWELYASHGERERRLADCYQKLLAQRRQQLSTGDSNNGAFAGCWNDYLC